MENTIDVWKYLRERFLQGDLIRVYELQQEIYNLKQDSKHVTVFFSELKTLWEELEIYMPILKCVCRNRSSCATMRNA